MADFEMDMTEEKPPKRIRKIIPEGWRVQKIIEGRTQKSKQGNEMIVLEFEDKEKGIVNDEYFVTEKGKRWKLKNLLQCLGIGGEDGNYAFNMKDILNKEVVALSEHEPNDYINRDGDKVETTQHVLNNFKSIKQAEEDGNVAWDE